MKLRVRYTIRDGELVASATIPDSTLVVRASLSIDEAIHVLSALGVERDDSVSGYGDEVGASWWTRLKRKVKNTVKKIAASKVFKAIGSVLKNPIFQALIPAPIAMAIGIAEKAAKAIGAVVKGGDQAAKAALAVAVDAARGGDKAVAQGLTLAAQFTGVKPSELVG